NRGSGELQHRTEREERRRASIGACVTGARGPDHPKSSWKNPEYIRFVGSSSRRNLWNTAISSPKAIRACAPVTRGVWLNSGRPWRVTQNALYVSRNAFH